MISLIQHYFVCARCFVNSVSLKLNNVKVKYAENMIATEIQQVIKSTDYVTQKTLRKRTDEAFHFN